MILLRSDSVPAVALILPGKPQHRRHVLERHPSASVHARYTRLVRLGVSCVMVAMLAGAAVADPLPVRWGRSNACEHCALSGPYRRVPHHAGQEKTRLATLWRPPRPYQQVRVDRTSAGQGSSLDLALKVRNRWYLRNLGEDGYDTWPHDEPRIDQSMAIDLVEVRDVVAGGPVEIVVVTTIRDRLHGDSRREVWVFSVDDGVPVSINPIDVIDPVTLVP